VLCAALQGHTALVTGSSSGIGRAVALRFAKEGADVAINHPLGGECPNAEAVAKEIRDMGRRSFVVGCDISDEAQVDRMVKQVHSEFGKIDILVNNAGTPQGGGKPVEELAISDFDRVMAVNVRGTFLCTRAVLPLMYERNYGRIINTSSQTAYRPCNPGFAHYVMSKGAINAFAKAVSLDISARGPECDVKINTVAPGVTLTPILEVLDKETLDYLKSSIPRGVLGAVDEVTPSYVFLASPEAKHMVGQCISPNGGEVFL